MKKILTSLALLAGVYVANAQHIPFAGYTGNLSLEIIEPTANQSFDCNADIKLVSKVTNVTGSDDLELFDTTLSLSMSSSLDSTFTRNGQDLQLLRSYDSLSIAAGSSLNFASKTIKVNQMYTVIDVAAQSYFTFHESPVDGQIALFARLAGVGGPNVQTGLFEATANYNDIDSTDDVQTVIINVTGCNTVSVKELNANTKQIAVYPNPATTGTVSFNYDFASNEVATINVIDVTGRTVSSNTINAKAGVQTVNVNVADLNTGMYQLEVVTSNGRGVSKFTVAK